jgi:rare lipoprotein A
MRLYPVLFAMAGVVALSPTAQARIERAFPTELASKTGAVKKSVTVRRSVRGKAVGKAKEIGKASWYGSRLHQGRRTASGTRFDWRLPTAAHRTLPLNSSVRVTNLRNGLSVTVVVTDRGPWRRDRVIDLSQGAAERIGITRQGIALVSIEPL